MKALMEWWTGRIGRIMKLIRGQCDEKDGRRHTPLMIRVPILVTKPLTLSDRKDERASVEPGSLGASKATHSCSPLLSDARPSCSRFRSHSSSQA